MTERDPGGGRPLEETSELAAAVDDETTVPQLITDGESGPDNPPFREPDDDVSAGPEPEADLVGAPMGGGTGGTDRRTGAEQPWDPEDLAAGKGLDPTPENVERARRELAEDGPAAIEKTVP
ncbi:MAG TPA: hypothetical protein VF462_09455 [Micromonosporaceae bacterium]